MLRRSGMQLPRHSGNRSDHARCVRLSVRRQRVALSLFFVDHLVLGLGLGLVFILGLRLVLGLGLRLVFGFCLGLVISLGLRLVLGHRLFLFLVLVLCLRQCLLLFQSLRLHVFRIFGHVCLQR